MTFRSLAGFVAVMAVAQSPGIEGSWQGELSLGTVKLRLGLRVEKGPTGEYVSKMVSIDQGGIAIPVRQTAFSSNKLHLDLPNLRATFDGTLNPGGSEIAGTFNQTLALPLTFKRVDKLDGPNRPQEPKPPFPYLSEEVRFENLPGSVRLAGTLTRPKPSDTAAPPFPAAILIAGSGGPDRDATVMGHKPFLVIADYLTRRGIAVLRLDNRGAGQSTGSLSRSTQADLAGDLLAAAQYLKSRNDIDPRRIGVIGHGEGGLVGALAAVQSESIGFVVLLAGPGVPGEQLIELQAEVVARVSGAKDPAIAKQRELQEIMFGIVKSEPDEKAAAEKMRAAWTKMKSAVPEAQRKNLEDADAAIDAQFAFLNSPYLRSELSLDPAETFKKLKVPVLAINGSRDVQVPPRQNLPPIAAALASGGNPDFTVSELPGLNNLFQTCRQCGISEYGMIEETFSPGALEVIGNWVAGHVKPH